ncbi:ATPase, T2SS/T4P/T4SS family [Marinomonas sp. 2405UD68-3]|uniref:ATPase, T2SS/T4P/T4SS family n=1 Tax=Marinomonas sp. 2405UD68-3 TaxID=3391835 RepID=UPI0039C9609C
MKKIIPISSNIISSPSDYCIGIISGEDKKIIEYTLSPLGIEHFFAYAPIKTEPDEKKIIELVLFVTGEDDEVSRLTPTNKANIKRSLRNTKNNYNLTSTYRLTQTDFDHLKQDLEAAIKKSSSNLIDDDLKQSMAHIISDCSMNGVSDIHIEWSTKKKLSYYYARYQGQRYPLLQVTAEEAESFLRGLYEYSGDLKTKTFDPAQSNDWRNEIESTLESNTTTVIRYNHMPGDGIVSATLRLAPRKNDFTEKYEYKDLVTFGFLPDQARLIEQQMLLHSGVIIFVGKTCSGKTTTARNVLTYKYLDSQHSPKFITLEDPIEMTEKFLIRVDLNKWTGTDKGELPVKDILRQDADVIYIGEIRNESGGSLAFESYNSGNLCCTTMHTTSPIAALNKLETTGKWKAEDVYNPEAIAAVIFQRLDPIICRHCALNWDEAFAAAPELNNNLDLVNAFSADSMRSIRNNLRFRNLKGCEHCKTNIKTLKPKPGIHVKIGEPGIAKMSISAETLISTPDLFRELRNRGIRSGEQFYTAQYRLLGQGSHVGLSSSEHAAHKVFKGDIDPVYYQKNHQSWGRFFRGGEVISMTIDSYLLKEKLIILNGEGFPYIKYIQDPEIIKPIQAEVRMQQIKKMESKRKSLSSSTAE